MVISKEDKILIESLYETKGYIRANFLNSFLRKTGQKAVYAAWLRVNIISYCYINRIFKMRNHSSFSEVTMSCFRGL